MGGNCDDSFLDNPSKYPPRANIYATIVKSSSQILICTFKYKFESFDRVEVQIDFMILCFIIYNL